jgi:hypothetical protein
VGPAAGREKDGIYRIHLRKAGVVLLIEISNSNAVAREGSFI